MELICFASPSDKTGKAIIHVIETELSDKDVQFCPTIRSLISNLSVCCHDSRMAVLVPADEKELIDIYSIHDLFKKVPVMLVLPSRDGLVEALGKGMKPRVMCYRDSSIAETTARVRKAVKGLLAIKGNTMAIC